MLLRKSKQPLKKVNGKYTGFSILMAKLFGQENKNSNFHNFLHGDMNNPDKVLNQRGLC